MWLWIVEKMKSLEPSVIVSEWNINVWFIVFTEWKLKKKEKKNELKQFGVYTKFRYMNVKIRREAQCVWEREREMAREGGNSWEYEYEYDVLMMMMSELIRCLFCVNNIYDVILTQYAHTHITGTGTATWAHDDNNNMMELLLLARWWRLARQRRQATSTTTTTAKLRRRH